MRPTAPSCEPEGGNDHGCVPAQQATLEKERKQPVFTLQFLRAAAYQAVKHIITMEIRHE
jgi:hypothetical protein